MTFTDAHFVSKAQSRTFARARGDLIDDFVVREAPGRVHVLNNLFVPGPTFAYSIGMGVRCQIVSEENAWEAAPGLDAARIVKDWGGTRFSDRGSLLDNRPVELGAAIRRANGPRGHGRGGSTHRAQGGRGSLSSRPG